MHHQQAAAVGGGVDHPPAHLHGRQHQPAEAARGAVVVARHVDQLGAAARQRMQGLDHALMGRVPARAALCHPPQVDDVADQVQLPALHTPEEIGELGRMAVGGAQMHIGDEDRAVHAACSCDEGAR